MSVLKFCVGKRAKKPYQIAGIHIRLYSMEELDYFIWENACLLDESFLQEDLICWIDEECGMEKLAKQLYEICHFDGTLHAFAGAVLSAVGIHAVEEIQLLEKRIKTYEKMEPFQREKTRADHFFLSGRYVLAMERYMALIDNLRAKKGTLPAEEKRTLSLLLHNMGTSCARMFFFEAAADFYEESYETGQDESELKFVLLCKRMQLTPMAFEAYMVEHTELSFYEAEVEQLMKQVGSQWTATRERIDLEAAFALKETGKPEESAKILQDKMEEWKKDYHYYVMH